MHWMIDINYFFYFLTTPCLLYQQYLEAKIIDYKTTQWKSHSYWIARQKLGQVLNMHLITYSTNIQK